MANILSCRPGSYGKYASTAYEHLAKIGVKYVEPGMPSKENVQALKADLDRYGLQAATLQGSCDIKNPGIGELFNVQAEAANTMGVTRIFVSVHSAELDLNVVYERLRAVGATAAKHGVTIIMETHPDLITNGDVAMQTMQGVDHPNIRVNFDTANVYYYNEGIDGIAEMKKVLDHIEGVHLKDTNGAYRTWHFPALGDGIVDFAEVLSVCNSRGFSGPFTMEIEGIQGEDLTLEQQQERVAKSVTHLRALGYDG